MPMRTELAMGMSSACDLSLPHPRASITQAFLGWDPEQPICLTPHVGLYLHPSASALLSCPISSQIFLSFTLGGDWHV